MSCSRYQQLLSRYVDGEVTSRQRQELLAHVAGCHDCAAWLAKARQADVLLKGVPETHPSDRVRDIVLGSVRVRSTEEELEDEAAEKAPVHRPAKPAVKPGAANYPAIGAPPSALRILLSGLLLRYDPSPRRVAFALVGVLVAALGLAYWLNLLPPLSGYDKLGFDTPHEGANAVNATPIPAISSGTNGMGGPVAVPNLVRLVPSAGEQNVDPGQMIKVRFDLPMDRASVEEGLGIDPPAAGTISWGADNEVYFAPAAPGLLRGITYTLTLSDSARSLAGTRIEQPLSWEFHTRNPYAVSPGTAPGSTIAPTSTFTLDFATPLDRASASNGITLQAGSPAREIPADLVWGTDSSVAVVPKSPLPVGDVYLQVAANTRTQSGDTLGKDYGANYRVALPVPRLRLLDGRAVVHTAGSVPVVYEAVADALSHPLQSVNVQLYALPSERLSALGGQDRAWPLGLPTGFLDGQQPVTSIVATTPGLGATQLTGVQAGTYLLVASAPSPQGMLSDWQLLVVADGNLALTGEGGAFWATDTAGHPWQGSEVSLYSPSWQLLEKGATGQDGLWEPSPAGSGAAIALARDTQGHLAAMLLDPATAQWQAPSPSLPQLDASMQTDLQQYQPGQSIHFRLLVHMPQSPPNEQDVTVILVAPGGQAVAQLALKPDSAGGVSGMFALASGAQAGTYTLRVRAGNAQAAFPVTVAPSSADTLSVYVAPGTGDLDSATAITRTVSVLGPDGQIVAGALITGTLGILGDTWASEPVTATSDKDGRATLIATLPTWVQDFPDSGMYFRAQVSSGDLHGSASQYLDLVLAGTAQTGMSHMVSPTLGVASVARRLPNGAISVRVVQIEQVAGAGLLITARAPSGDRRSWALDMSQASDVTLSLPSYFGGGSLEFFRAGLPGSRQEEIMPSNGSGPDLRLIAPSTVTAGASLPVTVTFKDNESAPLGGVASLWLRRVSGIQEGDAEGWKPEVEISNTGVTSATLTAPVSPGLWYVMVEAASEAGDYAQAWDVVDVQPGPYIQLPPAEALQVNQPKEISVIAHNPSNQEVAGSVRADGGDSVLALNGSDQPVQLAPGGWQAISWQMSAFNQGQSNVRFSFTPNTGIAASWNLETALAANPRTVTSHAAGTLLDERTVGVQVPSGLSGSAVQLEIHASSSMLGTLASIANDLVNTPIDLAQGTSEWAARLSAAPCVAAAFRRAGSEAPGHLELTGVERSAALQQLYGAQHADGGWGQDLSPQGSSDVTHTAAVLLAMRRQQLATIDAGVEAQPQVDSTVANRGLSYLAVELSRPLSEPPSVAALDERAYGLYTLSMYGMLQEEMARPYIVYAGQANHQLSARGQAWLALAMLKAGGIQDALALVDNLLASDNLLDSPSPVILEALVSASNVAMPGKGAGRDASAYLAIARDYARALMEDRQGAGWDSPATTADATWALVAYAGAVGEKPESDAPSITLNDRPVQATGEAGNLGAISIVLSGDALHAGTNQLKLKAPAATQPLYYSLTLRATR